MADQPNPELAAGAGQQAPGAPAQGAPAPPSKKQGFLSGLGGGSKKPVIGATQIAEIATDVSNVSTRLRILEERYENLRKKILVIEHNMLDNNKKLMTEIRASDEQIKEFSRVIEQMKEELKLIVRELKLTAKSDEMQLLKKYVSVWEPLNFVTMHEVSKMVEDAVIEKIPELAEKGFFEEEIRKAMKSAMGGKGSK